MLNKTPAPEIICVPPHLVGEIWPAIGPLLDEAYAAIDAPTPQNLCELAVDGKLLVWLAVDGGSTILTACTTRLYMRRSGDKVCQLVACAGGRMGEWSELGQRKIEEYARAEGCASIVAEGRPGWHRALDGYKEIRRVIEKRL